MRQKLLFTLLLMTNLIVFAQPQEWAFFRPTNTGVSGEIIGAVAIDSSNNMWTTGYYWFWSDGGVAVYDTSKIWHTWGRYDGYIPDERVYDIQFDMNQHVWVATDSGLAAFDGKEWVTYTVQDFGFEAYKFTSIAINEENNDVWATYENVQFAGKGGVVHYDGSTWTEYNVYNSGLPTSEVGGIAVDDLGNVWTGSIIGLLKYDGTNWIQFNNSNSPITGSVGSVIKDDQGNIWCISGAKGLIKYDGQGFSVIGEENSPLPVGNISALAVKGDKMIVGAIGFQSSGCYIFDGVAWTPFPAPNHVYDVAIDQNDHYWMCGIGHLWEFTGTEWVKYNTHNTGLPEFFNRDIFIDSRNHKWFSSGEGGGTHFDDTTWVSYNVHNEGFFPNPLWYSSICNATTEDIYGKIWMGYAGTYGAAIELDPETHQMTIWESDDAGVNLQFIQTMYSDSKGRVWVGLDGGGLSMYDRQDWHHYNKANSKLYSNEVQSIIEDQNGDIYIATYVGLARWRNGQIDTVFLPENNGFQYYNFREVEVDPSNALWLGTNNGLLKYDQGNWTFYDTSNSQIMCPLVTGIEIEEDGSLWISGHQTYLWPYYGGISHFDGTNWVHYYYHNTKLAHKQVEDIELDHDGNLWILTQSEGITVYNKGGLVNIDTLKQFTLPALSGSNTTTGIAGKPIVRKTVHSWPNPAFNQVSIDFQSPLPEKGLVQLVSADGRHALLPYQIDITSGNNRHKIDLSILPKGNYLLSIQTASSLYQAQIIHQ